MRTQQPTWPLLQNNQKCKGQNIMKKQKEIEHPPQLFDQ